MPDTLTAPDIRRELELTEQQAAELWAQAERVAEAYRSVARRADELRVRLQLRETDGELHPAEPLAGVLASV